MEEAGVRGGTRDAAGPVGGWAEGAGLAEVAGAVVVVLVFDGVEEVVVVEFSVAFAPSP